MPRRKIIPDKPDGPLGRVWAYGRVSTGRQKISIEYQDRRLSGYYEYRFKMFGHEYMGFFADDDTSGRIPLAQRDAGGRMCALLEAGDHIIITRPDRAFRNLADTFVTLANWEKLNISVHMVEYGVDTSTPMGKMAISFLAVFADIERRMISDRTKDVNTERRRQGLATGTPPVGYATTKRKIGRKEGKDIYERKLVINEYELRVGRRILLLRQNREQWMDIRDKFRQAEVCNRGGKCEWPPSVLYQWMKAYQKIVAEGKCPANLLPNASPESSDSSPSSANTASTPTPFHAPQDQ